MEAAEIVACFVQAVEDAVRYEHGLPRKYDEAAADRDRIKAALVEVLEGPWFHPCGDPECESHECEVWRKLEEACRGE